MSNNLLQTVGGNLKMFSGKTKFKLDKKSPEIFMGIGIATFVGTIIMASKATLKVDEIMNEHEDRIERIHAKREEVIKIGDDEEVYTEKDAKNDIVITYAKTAVAFGKAYAPAITLGVISITSFLVSNRILKKRYLGVVTAYNALDKAFKLYRSRVVEEGGEELDRHYMFGTKYETIEKKVTDEKGRTKKVEVSSGEFVASPYARIFDSSNKIWDKNPEFTMMTLRTQEGMLNNLLQTRGYVFLNEVYEALGYDMTTNGQFVGWVKGNGDNYIDFGLRRYDDPAVRDYINGDKNIILLDFNVDGVIVDKI